jgi:molybdopterin/thiamine biosynthesis adenylyltransferase
MNKGIFHHEEIYRGSLANISQTHITMCGVGALGSNLVDNLARQGFAKIRVIDFDRVELHNINTQIYSKNHVGALKVAALKGIVFSAVGTEIETENKELTQNNVKKLLKNTDLVVDVFDNAASRKIVTEYCQSNGVACLHAGLDGSGSYGQVMWNEVYKVPVDTGEKPACENAMARNLILLTVAVATEEIINLVNQKNKRNLHITLKDLSIRKE